MITTEAILEAYQAATRRALDTHKEACKQAEQAYTAATKQAVRTCDAAERQARDAYIALSNPANATLNEAVMQAREIRRSALLSQGEETNVGKLQPDIDARELAVRQAYRVADALERDARLIHQDIVTPAAENRDAAVNQARDTRDAVTKQAGDIRDAALRQARDAMWASVEQRLAIWQQFVAAQEQALQSLGALTAAPTETEVQGEPSNVDPSLLESARTAQRFI